MFYAVCRIRFQGEQVSMRYWFGQNKKIVNLIVITELDVFPFYVTGGSQPQPIYTAYNGKQYSTGSLVIFNLPLSTDSHHQLTLFNDLLFCLISSDLLKWVIFLGIIFIHFMTNSIIPMREVISKGSGQMQLISQKNYHSKTRRKQSKYILNKHTISLTLYTRLVEVKSTQSYLKHYLQ